jgi:hypothetical protein
MPLIARVTAMNTYGAAEGLPENPWKLPDHQ